MIDRPRFTGVAGVRFLRPREPVIELVVRGEARAYPLQILIWHEIVNYEIPGIPVAVTFCPLCNTALVFDRRVRGRRLSFGTTGNLRNSDLVMYDRQTESWVAVAAFRPDAEIVGDPPSLLRRVLDAIVDALDWLISP